MTNAPQMAARMGNQIYLNFGSQKAGEFIAFASGSWPGLQNMRFDTDPDPDLKRVVFDDKTWVVPKSIFWSHLHRMTLGYHDFILGKYSFPEFCEIEAGDVVLDCGSFIGGLASSAAGKASRVIAVEPSPINYKAANRNLNGLGNVTLLQCGLWNACGTQQFNISETAIDDGLLVPDKGEIVRTVTVQTQTVAALARSNDITVFDFQKIEAEGVELEILLGEGGLLADKIAVDCAPERNGESPGEEVTALLQQHGFETRKKGIVVFGRR